MKKETESKFVGLALPVLGNDGLNSLLSDHFGRAPGFLVIDVDGGRPEYLTGASCHSHECAPVDALIAAGADAVLARGMGAGALSRCRAAGLRVLEAKGESVGEALVAFLEGQSNILPKSALCHHGEMSCHHAERS